jgi:predicted transcriptional regulator
MVATALAWGQTERAVLVVSTGMQSTAAVQVAVGMTRTAVSQYLRKDVYTHMCQVIVTSLCYSTSAR